MVFSALALLGCTMPVRMGPMDDFAAPVTSVPQRAALPPAQGEVIGSGPVRVALLLPLSGNPSLASVGNSMLNSTRLAMAYIASSPTIGDNIEIVVKDTGGDPQRAASAAGQALAEGASLILGPLRAEEVRAAGQAARAGGVPVIGFSNNPGAASAGVYLLNVLPQVEAMRTLSFARSQGRQAVAAIVPTTDFGRIQEAAFRQAAADLGLTVRGIYSFSDEAGARRAVEQAVPVLREGAVDALFIPDRATAPSLGILLESAGIARERLTLIGSADWDGDAAILASAYLSGAVYPAVDQSGLATLGPDYQARFGTAPHPFATFAYTAVLLANSSALSLASPPYDVTQLTRPSGFTGRDGLFRFLGDGRSEHALAIRQVQPGGAVQIEAPQMPGGPGRVATLPE